MKCNVWFCLAKDYFVKGSSIEDCQRKAWEKLKSDYNSLTIQEINVRVVKK